MNNPRILFMGTPKFAVATLGALLMNGFNVVGVVTTPDKPAGRGKKLTPSPVKEFATLSLLPVLQPESLEEPNFVEEVKNLNPDVILVVAFRKIPETIWKIPPMGAINLHASLLPHYRGAAPINRAIINGETVTGLTTFLINGDIDSGNILLREEVPILPHENAGDLQERLMKKGALLVIKTLEGLINNTITPVPQSYFLKEGEKPKPAPKIFPDDCIINWNESSQTINNLVRGLSPVPCARTFIKKDENSMMLKIYESIPENEEHTLKPGDIISNNKDSFKIACGKGLLNIINLQLEGRKKMSASEFLRGFNVSEYRIVSNKPS